MTKTKTFDCVEMKRQGALALHEKLKGLSDEEKLAYYQKRARELRARIENLKRDAGKLERPSC